MQLKYSNYKISTRQKAQQEIWDIIRRKWIVLTPEEWVRQHFIHYLITEKQVPSTLISVEKKVILNKLTKRMDIVLYNRNGNPYMIVECKRDSIALSTAVFQQAAVYNLPLKVSYLAITNGIEVLSAEINHEKHSFELIDGLPDLSSLIEN